MTAKVQTQIKHELTHTASWRTAAAGYRHNSLIFVSLEDETGVMQVICRMSIRGEQRAALLKSRLLAVYGKWERQGEVRNLIAQRHEDLTPLLGRLATESRDFH